MRRRGFEPRGCSDYGFDITWATAIGPLLKLKARRLFAEIERIYERNLAAKGVTYVRGAGRFLTRAPSK